MSQSKTPVDPEEFAREFEALGPAEMARKYSVDIRNVHLKRKRVENLLGTILHVPAHLDYRNRPRESFRRNLEVTDGVIMVGSDCHYEPNTVTTAHLAFVQIAKKLKPKVIVLDGDLIDGSSIGRHPMNDWEDRPSVEQELSTAQKRLQEIQKASPKSDRYWLIGNHDQRFNSYLANNANQFGGVVGFDLKDHFKEWTFGMSLWISGAERPIVIKHRIAGGVHAAYNNTMKAGTHIVTGHTHAQQVYSWSDYTGHRYGVQCGTMANPHQPTFDYSEDGPKNWVSGFVVLTIKDGFLLSPEFVKVHKAGEYEWRGQIWKVQE